MTLTVPNRPAGVYAAGHRLLTVLRAVVSCSQMSPVGRTPCRQCQSGSEAAGDKADANERGPGRSFQLGRKPLSEALWERTPFCIAERLRFENPREILDHWSSLTSAKCAISRSSNATLASVAAFVLVM